jgi:hypothetical protein
MGTLSTSHNSPPLPQHGRSRIDPGPVQYPEPGMSERRSQAGGPFPQFTGVSGALRRGAVALAEAEISRAEPDCYGFGDGLLNRRPQLQACFIPAGVTEGLFETYCTNSHCLD